MVEVAATAAVVAAAAAVVVAAAANNLAAIMAYRVEVVDREVGLVKSTIVVTAAVVVNVGVNEEAETVVEALVQEGSMAGVTVMAEDAAKARVVAGATILGLEGETALAGMARAAGAAKARVMAGATIPGAMTVENRNCCIHHTNCCLDTWCRN
jgi:hypothetical protein